MTAVEAYELTTQGGATDFARLITACESFGPYCLIGGLAVNCYVEPVYTLDADIVVIATGLSNLSAYLREQGFKTEEYPHSVNARAPVSDLRIQFSLDPRYQEFVTDAEHREVLGERVPVASLSNIVRGKIWAWSDDKRRPTKRKKDELDLMRILESYPELRGMMPKEISDQVPQA